MENRGILFEMMEAKKKEWDTQVKNLQAKAAGFDTETRVKVEEQIKQLNIKLNEIENKTNEFRKTSNELGHDIEDKIIYSWIELFTKIDDAMLKLKK